MITFIRNLFRRPDWYFVNIDGWVRPAYWDGSYWSTRNEARVQPTSVKGRVPNPHREAA